MEWHLTDCWSGRSAMLDFIRRYQSAVHSGLLVVLGMIAFWPSVSFDFVNWDDPVYVQNNPLIRSWSPENLKAISTEVIAKNYAPLTSVSFMLDYSLWELNPCGYHATNVILHLVNGVLVYLLICQLSESRFVGFFTTALFLVHPVQIESVAWISSRKGLLCSMFMLGACLVRLKPVIPPKADGRYFGLLALALLCKAHAVVLPAIVLIYDLLVRQDKPSKAIPRQVIPGLMSLALLVVTMGAQNSMIGGVRSHMTLNLIQIVAVDVTILWKYLGMLLMPTHLCVMYDPPVSGIRMQVIVGTAGFIAIGLAVWRVRKTAPMWLAGTISILLLLFPMLNFFRITTLMNDRYLYLPCIIVFAFAMTALRRLMDVSAESLDGILSALAGGVRTSIATATVLASMFLTSQYLPVWANSQSLWAHASKNCSTLPVVRIQSALTAHGSGQIREAVRLMKIALIETKPDELDRERMQDFIVEWTSELASSEHMQNSQHLPSESMGRPAAASNPSPELHKSTSMESPSAEEQPAPYLSAVK